MKAILILSLLIFFITGIGALMLAYLDNDRKIATGGVILMCIAMMSSVVLYINY